MPAQVALVSGHRHQQYQQAQPDLHATGEPRRVNHPDQVVLDEPASVPGLPGLPTQVVLQQRERAGEARELHQGAVDRRGNMRPDDPRPPPREEDTAHDEADEQQMDDHHKVSASPVPHHLTCPDNIPSPAMGLPVSGWVLRAAVEPERPGLNRADLEQAG